MNKRIFQAFFSIFSLILTAFLLTGCDESYYGSSAVPGAEETDSPASDAEDPASESAPPAPFSHANRQTPSDTVCIFPDTAPFIDNTGNSIQRDDDFLYFYSDGRLMCYHTQNGQTTLLYQTASTHKLSFCLSEDFIYFVERAGYDSLDDRDTSLYRMEKNGKNLTLLRDDIINAGNIRDWKDYSIDIYDNIIYLINYTSGYENGNYVKSTANLYYKLESDGSVSEIEESETLYGMLPPRFEPICGSGFPSFPYAMRNYGYLFVQDSQKTLYRMNPADGSRENLGINISAVSYVTFSGDAILLHPDYEGTPALYSLSDKTTLSLEDPFWENTSCLTVFPTEQGFYYCGKLYEKNSSSDEATSLFFIRQILPDGSVNTLIPGSLSFPFGESVYYGNLEKTTCQSGDYIYYFKDEEAQHNLMRCHIQKSSDFQMLSTWSSFPASSPAEILSEETDEKTEIGEVSSVSCSMKKLFLEEKTYSDTLINQILREVYADFEAYVDDITKNEREQIEAHPELYEGFSYSSVYDFSLYTSLDYMDDDTISFCCSYYQYYAYAAHGYYWNDYYVFDRRTGKRLSFEDFVGDPASIINTVRPYVEKVAGWDFDSEMLVDVSRFSLSEDGFTLYFAPYDIDCYAAGAFLVTIPYEAFEREL